MRMVFACANCGEPHDTPEEAKICCGHDDEWYVTSCCQVELGERTVNEFPFIGYVVECCTECGEELD